jgi:hypothetical protein
MTREEHIKWCKQRAIEEFDYYPKFPEALRNGLTSMMSDINKHPGTRSDALQSLCLMQLMGNRINSRQEFVNFINGFH